MAGATGQIRGGHRRTPHGEAARPQPPHLLDRSPGTNVGRDGTLDEAIAHYSYLLGNSLKDRGKLDKAKAIAAYREAVRVMPEFPEAYSALVLALKDQGKLDEAVATYRDAIRLKPDDAVAHLNLGGILRTLGDFAGSLAMLRTGHELGSKQPGWPYPSAQWVAEAQRRAALAERLTLVLKGESAPKDNAERLALAALCYDTRRFAAAARLTAEALEIDPKLGDDLKPGRHPFHRHNAAGFAFLAGVGQGEDDPRPDEAARQRLRARPETGSAPTSGCTRRNSTQMTLLPSGGPSCT